MNQKQVATRKSAPLSSVAAAWLGTTVVLLVAKIFDPDLLPGWLVLFPTALLCFCIAVIFLGLALIAMMGAGLPPNDRD